VEPDPIDERRSLRTYVCQSCDGSQTHIVIKRKPARDEAPQRAVG